MNDEEYRRHKAVEEDPEFEDLEYDRKTGQFRQKVKSNGGDTAKKKSGGDLTEEKFAKRFQADYQGELHYDHHRGRWYVYVEERGCWVRNETRLAYHFARELCCRLNTAEAKEFARAQTY